MQSETSKTEKILVVDDDESTATLVKEALTQEGYEVDVVGNGFDAIRRIDAWSPDLVLLDINMPELDGLQALRMIRQKAEYISTVFVSANSDIKDIIKGLDLGADDYICKPFNILELLARVRSQLRIKQLQRQLKKANNKLKRLVDVDDLTGLYNMRSLYDRLENELARCRRFRRSVAVVMIDMDNFKSVNDENDHLFGSFVLAEMGKIIKSSVRKIDIAARYGGDEFLIVLSEVNLGGVISFCERLRKKVQKYKFANEESEKHLTCSIGFAITDVDDNHIDARDLVKKADHALYDAKELGRNCVCYYDLSDDKQKKALKVS